MTFLAYLKLVRRLKGNTVWKSTLETSRPFAELK